MFLQKCIQYMSGKLGGEDENGDLYKGIIGFMIAELKESVPYVIQAIPEVTFTGKWLCEKIAENIKTLSEAGFRVRAVVSDNHSTNVTAFSSLLKRFKSPSSQYFMHPSSDVKTYLFFDNVQLAKKYPEQPSERQEICVPFF